MSQNLNNAKCTEVKRSYLKKIFFLINFVLVIVAKIIKQQLYCNNIYFSHYDKIYNIIKFKKI